MSSGEPFPTLGTLLRERPRPQFGQDWLRVFAGDEGVQWVICGVGRFWVVPSGNEVRYRLAEGGDPSDAEQALLGPVLGTALRLQGVSLLHASALVIDGRAVALSAPSGHGKSTLAAALARGGWAVLSDDVLPLRRRGPGFLAVPYFPRMKLWADSLRAFGAEAASFRPVLSWGDKRRVGLEGEWGSCAQQAAPLAAVYFLAPHNEAAHAPQLTALASVEATLALQAGMYLSDLEIEACSAQGLRMAAEIATQIPVRRLSYRRTFDALPAVCEAIAADVAALELASR